MSRDEPTPRQSVEDSFETSAPVVAEIVESASSEAPLRFSLRGMLIIIACCCGLFAFMAYFGVLAGMVAALVGCLALLLGTISIPIVCRLGPNSRQMALLDALAIRLTVAILLLVFGVVLAGGGELAFTQLHRMRQQSRLEKQLGFTADTQYVYDKQADYGGTWEAVTIDSIEAGGLLDGAGFLEGDVVATEMTPQEFFEMLEENRGGSVTITVDRSGNTALDPANQVDLVVRVPE